ncbi:MAG: phage holin family protein [Gemmobacter sp.]
MPEAPNLLADVVGALGRILRGEIALAQAEIRQGLRAAALGLALIVVAAVLLVTAIQLFAGAGVNGLVHAGLRPWQAQLVLGGVLVVLAALLGLAAQRRLRGESLMPQRALAGLRRDAETLKPKVNPDAA